MLATGAETYFPSNWINDPFCLNTNYIVVGDTSNSPIFSDNGVQRGTLYASSPIGASIALTNTGDVISCAGQVTFAGNVNTIGNMQFRLGLFYRGANTTDTNWLGYMVGNPTVEDAAKHGIYVKLNPNTTIFASGAPDKETRVRVGAYSYNLGWGAGTYDVSLSVRQLVGHAQEVSWKLSGIASNSFSFAGTYTNDVAAKVPAAFDQVGFLGGAALFDVSTNTDSISFKNMVVTYTKGEANP